MEIIKTRSGRTLARLHYDVIDQTTTGSVYTTAEKAGEETYVGEVTDEVAGTATYHILPEFEGKDYILQDCEELREEFANYSNFWTARQSRGVC